MLIYQDYWIEPEGDGWTYTHCGGGSDVFWCRTQDECFKQIDLIQEGKGVLHCGQRFGSFEDLYNYVKEANHGA